MDKLGFLALIVALSAYLASVRIALITRIGSEPKPRHRWWLKLYVVSLIPADAPLVLAGLFLTAQLFSKDLSGPEPADWLYPAAKGLFVFAVGVLAAHHIALWIISIYKLCTHKELDPTNGTDNAPEPVAAPQREEPSHDA